MVIFLLNLLKSDSSDPTIISVKHIINHYSRNLKLRFITIVLGIIPISHCLGFFKSIPDSLPDRAGYLSFQAPPKLRFQEVDAVADRKKLLRLKSNAMKTAVVPETGKVNQDPTFPLVSYTDENASSPIYVLDANEEVPVLVADQLLPPNDPFVVQDLTQPNLNNTDELIEILESGINSSNRSSSTNVNFVPPFTLDGANLILESKSRYTRRPR